MAVKSGDRDGWYNITWNAHILAGDDTGYAALSSKIKIKSYGVYYATGADEISRLMAGDSAAIARMQIFGSGDDIDVYSNYGFRLKGIPAGKTRCAMFCLVYEYSGKTYTVLSPVDSVSLPD